MRPTKSFVLRATTMQLYRIDNYSCTFIAIIMLKLLAISFVSGSTAATCDSRIKI